MFHNSFLFRHCLPGDSVSSHRLRTWSHETACPHSRRQSQVQADDWLHVRGSHDPLLGSDDSSEWLAKLREAFYYYQFTIKDSLRTSYTEETRRAGCEGEMCVRRARVPPLGTPPAPHLHAFAGSDALQTPVFRVFVAAALHRPQRPSPSGPHARPLSKLQGFLEALSQELRAGTKCIFLTMSRHLKVIVSETEVLIFPPKLANIAELPHSPCSPTLEGIHTLPSLPGMPLAPTRLASAHFRCHLVRDLP